MIYFASVQDIIFCCWVEVECVHEYEFAKTFLLFMMNELKEEKEEKTTKIRMENTHNVKYVSLID